MKLTTLIKTAVVTAVTAATVLLPAAAAAITPGSVPYNGDQTQGADFPAFNIFFNVPSVGNEADFIRVKKDGEANSTLRNTVDSSCKTGDRFDVWFYVHNGAKPSLNNNGTGPGVAKDVVAKVVLPTTAMSNFPISGGLTASNAQAINDSALIKCGGKQFKLKYVDNSAQAFLDQPNQTVSLPKAIVEGGTPIGSNLLNGQVWGCWEQRVWMQLKVEVEEVPPVKLPAVCTALSISQSGHTVTVKDVDFKANDSTVNSIRVDFGDGTVKTVKQNEFPISHTYTGDTSRTITATLLTDKGEVTSTNCKKTVSFVTPPVTVLPNTGVGSLLGIFTVTSLVGAFAHRKWSLSRS